MSDRVLVVDDEPSICLLIKRVLTNEGMQVDTVGSGVEALAYLERGKATVIVTDIRMPEMSGLELLEKVRQDPNGPEVIIMTAFGDIDTAMKAVRQGARDFLTKPLDFERLLVSVRNAMERSTLRKRVEALASQIQSELNVENIVAANIEMLNIFDTIRRIRGSDVNVVIFGESGTGKELIARAIHANSQRNAGPFVPVSCVSLAESLLESELFGHEKGSFTGAAARRIGYFESANGGTIFLDEIGDMPLALQSKLLRAIQEKSIQRVGGTQLIPVDARIVCATNRNLTEMVHAGTFREDLFYRLNVLRIELPPLRKRLDDIPRLAGHFVKKYAERTGSPVEGIHDACMKVLLSHDWPGNVRELENIIQRAVALTDAKQIRVEDLPEEMCNAVRGGRATDDILKISSFNEAKKYAIDHFEREYIAKALKRHDGNVTSAAKEMGIERTALQRLLKKHRIKSGDYKISD